MTGIGSAGCVGLFMYYEKIRRNFGLFLGWSIVFTVSLGFTFGILSALAPFMSPVLFGTMMTSGVWIVQTMYVYQPTYKYTPFRGFVLTTLGVILAIVIVGFADKWLPAILGGALALFTSYSMYVYALKLVDTKNMPTAGDSPPYGTV